MTVVDDHFVRSADNGEFDGRSTTLQIAKQSLLVQLSALRDGAMVQQCRNGRCPFLEFVDPVGQRTQGSYDQVRTKIVLLFSQ